MAGKKLTEEEKFKFFQRMLELEPDIYWKRRYIRQWREGRIKIFKKRGRICLESPADMEIILDGRGGCDFLAYNDPRLKPMIEKRQQEFLDRMLEELELLEKKAGERKTEAEVIPLNIQKNKNTTG